MRRTARVPTEARHPLTREGSRPNRHQARSCLGRPPGITAPARQTLAQPRKQSARGPQSTRLNLVLSGSAAPGPRHARLPAKTAVGDTQRTMPKESTTPDLAELNRRLLELVIAMTLTR